MITVDVYVPVLDKSFDFNLNEDVPVGAVIEELVQMICQKEHWPEIKEPLSMTLSCPQLSTILSTGSTLREGRVTTGFRLLLT